MIETIKKLFSSKEFYKTIKDKKVGSAVGIIALLSLIIGVVIGVLFYLQSGATLKSDIDGFVQNNIVSEFPSDLKVTNVSGVLSSNLNPITFGEQSELLDEPVDGVTSYDYERGPTNVLTIDTTKEATMRNLEDSGSAIFIGSDGMIAVKSNGQVQAVQAKDFPDFVADKAFVNDIAAKVSSYTYIVGPAIAFGILIMMSIFTFIAWIITSFIVSLVVLIVSKFAKHEYNWDQSVRIAFYVGIPIIFILNIISAISQIELPMFWPTVVLVPAAYFLYLRK